MGRKFRHKDGFGDDTDYLEIIENGDCILHYKKATDMDSKNVSRHYTLNFCIDRVNEGIWVELNQSVIKRIGNFFRRICSGKK